MIETFASLKVDLINELPSSRTIGPTTSLSPQVKLNAKINLIDSLFSLILDRPTLAVG